MRLSKRLTTVTPLSKYLAMVLFILFPITSFFLGMQITAVSFLAYLAQAGLISIGLVFLLLGLFGAGCTITLQIITMLEHLLPLIQKITEVLKTMKAEQTEKKMTIMTELPQGQGAVPLSAVSDTLKEVTALTTALTKAPAWLAASLIGSLLISLGVFLPRFL